MVTVCGRRRTNFSDARVQARAHEEVINPRHLPLRIRSRILLDRISFPTCSVFVVVVAATTVICTRCRLDSLTQYGGVACCNTVQIPENTCDIANEYAREQVLAVVVTEMRDRNTNAVVLVQTIDREYASDAEVVTEVAVAVVAQALAMRRCREACKRTRERANEDHGVPRTHACAHTCMSVTREEGRGSRVVALLYFLFSAFS